MDSVTSISQIIQEHLGHVFIGLRNLIIHEYFGVDDQTIWSIVTVNIPQLKQYLSEFE